ncbi:MAG: HAMP domain-containing histidine kinase [Paludibacteraceae bacterium]|nr:HAMP domain-containing histidine kinase [Paludibacteraceae bacterium]
MKLIRYTYIRLFSLMFMLFILWGALFYISMMDEVMDETDDRLLNNKGLVVHRMLQQPERLLTADTLSDNYRISRISEQEGLNHRDSFYDTKIYIQIENEYEPMRVYKSSFKDNSGQFYEIELYLSTIERDNVIEDILFYLIILFVVMLGITLVGMRLVLKRTFRPLYKLLDWLNSVIPGREAPELNNETEIAEFKKLNDAAVNMQKRSRKAYEEQKDFIGNASHELQTPLAISLNKLDMLANSGELNEEQMNLLSQTFETLQRATRLNKSLLLLSQIQNEQFVQVSEQNLTQTIQRVLNDMLEVYSDKNIMAKIETESDFIHQMNDSLAVVLINNLLKNAIVHSSSNSLITITSHEKSLTISNEGQTALDNEKIFTRFYRAGNSKTKESTGLGLTIAKEIAQLSGLSLEYFYDGKHNFRLKK